MPAIYPDIRFNSSTGSDTAASGAGPSVAVTGTAAAHTNGVASTTITLTNSPDLSGVATDGSAAIWLNTTSGRQWSKITAKDDTAKTVTVENSFTIASGSAVNYAIGGKRATFNETNSRKLFTSDVGTYWTITTETDQSLTSSIACTFNPSQFYIRGDSDTNHRVITQTANAACFSSFNAANLWFLNLKFQCTAATKTSAGAYSGGGNNAPRFFNCIIGDSTNTLSYAASGVVNAVCVFTNCYIATTSTAISTSGASTSIYIENCFFNMPVGIKTLSYLSSSIADIRRSIFKNGTIAIELYSGVATILNNVFYGQSTNAIQSTSTVLSGRIENNIFHSCTVPITLSSSQPSIGFILNRNCFYNSGANSNTPTDPYQISSDPQFANIGTNDFRVGNSALIGVSYPFNNQNLGISSGTGCSLDVGAGQEAGGSGGGLLLPRAMNGGYSA